MSIIRPKSKILVPLNFWAGYASASPWSLAALFNVGAPLRKGSLRCITNLSH